MKLGLVALAGCMLGGECALRRGFDLLNDGDDVADSSSSTLEELKSLGSALDAKASPLTSPRGSGVGLVNITAGSTIQGGAQTVVVADAAKENGIFIPYGKNVPQMPGVKHYTATGHQECKACQQIINTMYLTGAMFPDLTWGLPPEYKEMGQAQQAVLQACPEFMNNWCYEDLGGTQMLRSPCPAYLTCHYCLGLNPLHCLPDDLSDKTTFYR